MSKLKNIIRQLSNKDYLSVYESLMNSNAEKSAYLLKYMREKQLSDSKIMETLAVNSNAYYTLRSRLNQKIEEYLLQQMESPRTNLIKKVATINEIIFTKKKAIAIATLKKLEKELLDYDLSNELTIVYKTLKKLHINTPDHFTYSQLYNRHVAFMLALDKAEELLANYFTKYGDYLLTKEETIKLELSLLKNELINVSNLYQSHRLHVYQNCISIFHSIHVEALDKDHEEENVELIFEKVQKTFDSYYMDAIYYHLILVYEYLRFEHYHHTKSEKKADKYYEDVNESAASLITNYSLYTFPPQFLLSKLDRFLANKNEKNLYEENKVLLDDFEVDKNDIPQYIIYTIYRSLGCYYAGKYEEAAKWTNTMLNNVSLKKMPYVNLEIKLFLALQYCILKDYDLFNQLINSIQRQIRLLGKNNCVHVLLFSKILKTAISDGKKSKIAKAQNLLTKLSKNIPSYYSPLKYIRLDEDFISRIG